MIEHDEEAGRFTLEVNGETAYVTYHRAEDADGVLVYSYVFVPPSGRGTGAAGRLLKHAFTYAKDQGLKVRPTCGYIAGTYLPRHPEWADVLE